MMTPFVKRILGPFRFPTKIPVVAIPYPAPYPPVSPTGLPVQSSTPIPAREG